MVENYFSDKFLDGFVDEMQKISQAENVPDNLITKDRFKRFAKGAIQGAIGSGLGFGVGGLVGRPLERKLIELGLSKGPAKVLRYALPTATGLGAALSLSRMNLRKKLFEKVRGEDAKRHKGTEQQPRQLG